MLFRTDLKEIEFRKTISTLIKKESEDTFLSHWNHHKKFGENILVGKKENDGFKFWRSSQSISGIFHPIFEGEYLNINDQFILKLNVKLNIISKVFLLFLIIPSYGFLFLEILNLNFPSPQLIIFCNLLFFAFSCPVWMTFITYKKQTIADLKKVLILTEVAFQKD